MASSKASTVDCSLQEQKEQVIDVMFLCDEWKSSKGGLSTFNREFAINMAETATSSMKIHCYVSKSDDQDREDARQHGVNLITAPSIPGSDDSLERLKFPPSELPNPHLVIGHGRKFGGCAYFLVQATKCRWIQFVHVYCEDLGKYKESTTAATDSIEENEAKHKKEIELCKAADAVVAVGSRLQQKYSRSLPNVKVEIITPGIFEKFSCESQFALHRSVKNFHVFLFGRATFEDLSLKGYDIVANAIGSLGKNFQLTFVGSPPGGHQKVEQWFLENTCINRYQLTIRGYCSDPEELKMMFYQSDLVALPSRTEGFGLVALEAISAGVPILVSGESGIAEALREVEGGNTVIVESDEGADEWAQRIIETSIESAKEREAKAKRLRENYRKVYSWRTECARFRRMIENVMKTANDEGLNIKVDAEELKPKETNMQTTTITVLPTEGSVSHSGTEDCQAHRVLSSIAMNYLKTTPPQSREEHNKFKEYLREMRVIITGVSEGSLVITVKCKSLQILEKLWTDYSSGRLGEMVQNCFVTEKILKEHNLTELKLKTTMDIEEYKARKVYFERVALRDSLCSKSYFKSSEGREPHLERGKQKIEVAESKKMKGEILDQASRLLAAEKPNKDLSSMFSRPRSSRSAEQEKTVAQAFVKFLEDNGRKEDMPVLQLKNIYQGEFRLLNPSVGWGISFSRVLNALTYHLNECQRLQDHVIFGGGDAAALQLLTDDLEEPQDNDDLCLRSPSGAFSRRPFYCEVCKRGLGNLMAYNKHLESVKHRQQNILITIRKSLNKPELVFDKNGIKVTSDPAADEHGVIELKVESGKYGQIVLIIENLGEENITLKDITLLWSVNFFDYREISSIDQDEGELYPGCQKRFRIGCKRRQEFGYSYVPGVLTFQMEDGVEFHILRFFSVRIVSDLYDELKPTSEYRPPQRVPEIPRDVKTFGGIPLPRLQRNSLIMEKLELYEIPFTVKAQVIKSNQIREGLRERLKKKLSFDNYKEKLSLLLHVEELQMQKDIRNYDMKGVIFQQERGDRRFLILEVPGLAENRPSVLRGDKIYAYEPGVLKQRYEGIVHKVQMLDVKLGFDMNDMPYVKNKKFDIQFTFHRLPVQMEHRACERIASVNRQDMRHVLFPSKDCLDRRGEILKEVSFFYDRNLNSEQEQAVQKIVSGSSRPAPYLVFGPPGTGKTVTLVEAIKQVHALIGSSYILACAPENSAADLLAERLLPHVDKGKLFRMYAASRPWDFVPPKLKDARVVNFDPVSRDVYFPSKEELMSDYRIIVTTLVTAGRLVSAFFPRSHFTHIFIDEAGHATEPECIIPVADLLDPYNPRGGQLVLAGDPKQLGPILRSRISQKYGLETSLLERLMTSCPAYVRGPRGSYDPNLLTKLVNNYRSHRAIIEIPKQLFYDNELNECAGDFRNVMIGWEELPNKNFPIIFHPVFGKDEREGSSPSFFNVPEVETIERYLRKLLDDNVRSRGLKHLRPEMIGVISPYKRQVQKIQKMIEKKRFGDEIKVGSVEEFQGQERRVIILSTVRSTKKEYLEMDKDFRLGFLNNPKRFNVAITRAQALLILIGNPDMLCLDDNWKTFVDYCRKNKATVDVERKEKVEDIADTLKRLKLFSAAASEYDEDGSEISQRQLQEHPEWTRHE